MSKLKETEISYNRVVDWAKLTRFLEALWFQNIGMSSPVSIKTISVTASIRMLIKLKEENFEWWTRPRIPGDRNVKSIYKQYNFRNWKDLDVDQSQSDRVRVVDWTKIENTFESRGIAKNRNAKARCKPWERTSQTNISVIEII